MAANLKRSFYEIERSWPDGYASITIKRNPDSKVSHLDVYKGTCAADYLACFSITAFSPGDIPDMLPNNLGWPIVSARCSGHFSSCEARIGATFHPIRPMVPPTYPQELLGFNLLVTSVELDCLDLDSESIRWFDDTRRLARSYTRLRFLGSRIPEGVSFFGVKRVPCVHVVADSIRQKIDAGEYEGISFRKCELSE